MLAVLGMQCKINFVLMVPPLPNPGPVDDDDDDVADGIVLPPSLVFSVVVDIRSKSVNAVS